MGVELPRHTQLSGVTDPSVLDSTQAGRWLATIRRDMDLKGRLMRMRRRNEEVLSLAYQDGTMIGGGSEWENLRENALNLPYRYARWLESQATSKKMVVKVSRDAGAGQRPGGPGDDVTGMWVGLALERIAYEAGFEREIKSVIGEVLPRGTSVMGIGFHKSVIGGEESKEAGKDAQSVIPEALSSDFAVKEGQDHARLAEGLEDTAQNPRVQMGVGTEGVAALTERMVAHGVAAVEQEYDRSPISDTRTIRRKIWMRKLRVGEDVGWSPHIYDVEDATFWWERQVWTVAEVKRSTLFRDEFKAVVHGYDGRNVSGVMSGGQTPSTDSMGSDARQAQGEDVLTDDERFVEWYALWFRRPDMKAGGIRKIVAPEYPEDTVETDESNPHVDDRGYGTIPGFYPFYDFTPVLSSLTVPERTCGIPPIAVGMPQFEKIAEYNRLRHESALRHSLRLYQIHPGLKDNKKLLDALKNGEDGFAFLAPDTMNLVDGRMSEAVLPIQFTGNTQEIDRQAAREEGDWVKVMAMPPAVLQGMGTAETATQDQIGVAAGERESSSLVEYFEKRMADVLSGIRGLMRSSYDDETFIRLLGEEGASVIKAWQVGTADDGDKITVTFGARAVAQEAVEKKQLMEAITLEKSEVEPMTGLPVYDTTALFEELHRRLDVGAPQKNAGLVSRLQQLVVALMGQVQQQSGGGSPGGNGKPGSSRPGGPNPSEGEGPTVGNLNAGVRRGTLPQDNFGGERGAGVVPAARQG